MSSRLLSEKKTGGVCSRRLCLPRVELGDSRAAPDQPAQTGEVFLTGTKRTDLTVQVARVSCPGGPAGREVLTPDGQQLLSQRVYSRHCSSPASQVKTAPRPSQRAPRGMMCAGTAAPATASGENLTVPALQVCLPLSIPVPLVTDGCCSAQQPLQGDVSLG